MESFYNLVDKVNKSKSNNLFDKINLRYVTIKDLNKLFDEIDNIDSLSYDDMIDLYNLYISTRKYLSSIGDEGLVKEFDYYTSDWHVLPNSSFVFTIYGGGRYYNHTAPKGENCKLDVLFDDRSKAITIDIANKNAHYKREILDTYKFQDLFIYFNTNRLGNTNKRDLIELSYKENLKYIIRNIFRLILKANKVIR